jgi:nucleoside-diphosphate-sugar epimerase
MDVARAYRLALTGEARGAFNLAAEPVIATEQLRQLFRAPSVPIPARVLRMAAEASFRLHLQPSEPGWLDMALAVPLMDTSRARAELGWSETRSSLAAFAELLDGLREGAGLETPPLEPGGAGPLRLQELLSGVGSRLG